ncbi:aromatic amino acid ammonia-lyase [Ruegeria profundi]|uniref:aromatic amino acid ammonia-lyase n=1 Tax=Ruegeria profundi TaxID=1685378 RepID=UPI001CD794D2|nr:aromatic amino acid ammonia-lyase [Ruegeria profundi]MCA0930405.1 aromatic amino acid lyase [Ruegeria profundi]
MEKLWLDGTSLTVEALSQAARNAAPIELAPAGLEAMARSHALVGQAIRDRVPVYGVTTGLGARATEVLSAEALAEFSVQTLRGRAHAIGPEEVPELVRAGLIVRLNTMLKGHSAARPEVAEHIAACLNAGLTPVVGQIGSIGAADLVLNATAGLALIGGGRMRDSKGRVGPSADMMEAHGIKPLNLAPRDGLALANHSSTVSGMAALAVSGAAGVFEAAQTAAALSMEGFRANTGPLAHHVLMVKPHPGQLQAAERLRLRLEGGALLEPGHARRLQDPLSFRNIAQIHGAAGMALTRAEECLELEINSASDNPVAFAEKGEITSCGAYFTAEITSAVETLSRSLVPLAAAQLARTAKLLNPEFSVLPNFLAMPDSSSNGFAPVMKVAESLFCELAHTAQPVPVWPSLNANGVEDCLTNSPAAVKALLQITGHLQRLTAIELLVACQAVELRGTAGSLGSFLSSTCRRIREISPALNEDRPLAEDIERLAESISQNRFAAEPRLASNIP